MDIQKVNVYGLQGVFCELKTIQLNREGALLASVHQMSQAIAGKDLVPWIRYTDILLWETTLVRTETTNEDALLEYSYIKCLPGERGDVTCCGCYPEAQWRI